MGKYPRNQAGEGWCCDPRLSSLDFLNGWELCQQVAQVQVQPLSAWSYANLRAAFFSPLKKGEKKGWPLKWLGSWPEVEEGVHF